MEPSSRSRRPSEFDCDWAPSGFRPGNVIRATHRSFSHPQGAETDTCRHSPDSFWFRKWVSQRPCSGCWKVRREGIRQMWRLFGLQSSWFLRCPGLPLDHQGCHLCEKRARKPNVMLRVGVYLSLGTPLQEMLSLPLPLPLPLSPL